VRTLLAPGSGDGTPIRLQRGADCAGPIVVYARIDPARSEGALRAGDIDDEGFGLHLRYTIDATDVVPRTTYVGVQELDASNSFAVEFGPGTHALNYGGSLELVGGVGLWTVDIQARALPIVHLHWHWLLWRVPVNLSGGPPETAGVFLPTHHSTIGCYNGLARVLMTTGETVVLGQTAIPAFGAVAVMNTGSGDSDLWFFSGWFG
jgi:hypothetical protein